MAQAIRNPINEDAFALFDTTTNLFIFLTPIMNDRDDLCTLCPVNCVTITRWKTKPIDIREYRATHVLMGYDVHLVYRATPSVLCVHFNDFGKAWLSGSEDEDGERVCRPYYKVRLLIMPTDIIVTIRKLIAKVGPVEQLPKWLADSDFLDRYTSLYREYYEPFPRHVTRLILQDAIVSKQTCSVTLDPITVDNVAVTSCGHVFTQDGIRKALDVKSECPVCRSNKCSIIVTDGILEDTGDVKKEIVDMETQTDAVQT
jgi:hypothetical protein